MAPARISRTSVAVSSKSRKPRQKHQKRNLDAYAIAAAENPEKLRVRKHRLGDFEDAGPPPKRSRHGEEDDEDDEELDDDDEGEEERPRKRRQRRGDDSDIDEGSDSDGNNWRMGTVEDDEDSDIDSDEAFGESDEERFEGFTFRGSEGGNKKPAKKFKASKSRLNGDIDLSEGESEEEEEDDDSLGEDAVDLATMLDNADGSEEDQQESGSKSKARHSFDEGLDSEDESGQSALSFSDDEGDEEDPQKLLRLQDLISSLNPAGAVEEKKRRRFDALESTAPSDSANIGGSKLDLADLLPTTAGSQLRKAAKILRDDVKSSKRNGIPAKVEVPLPKRHQDKLDRIAANEKTKETLERWVDTVKQNRRAEHLSFPLKYADQSAPQGTDRFLPNKPENELENTIQSILQESGLVKANGEADEERIRKFEELQTNKLPVEEVEARRAELRKARELLFREEVRAKRIKKIKSKSYRRVHRKERERLEEKERALLKAEGVDLSEEERELNDRRRAEERMGTRHRESKWAKGVKKSGKAAWDEDARAGVTEMARRNEELRKRIHGKDVRNESEEESDVSSGEDESEIEDVEERQAKKINRQLSRISGVDGDGQDGKGLHNMAFMKRAEAARRAQNEDEIKRIQKDIAEEDGETNDEEEEENFSGRKRYGPTVTTSQNQVSRQGRNEFEEHEEEGSDDGREEKDVDIIVDKDRTPSTVAAANKAIRNRPLQNGTTSSIAIEEPQGNPWLAPAKKDKKQQSSLVVLDTQSLPSKAKQEAKQAQKAGAEIVSAPDADGWQTVTYAGDNEDDTEEEASDEDPDNAFRIQHRGLMLKAFAGDDAVAEFEDEKAALVDEEDEKMVVDTMAGWGGGWVGEGLTKKERAQNKKKKVMKKQEGIKPSDRKDNALHRVIINEKRVRKNSKYLAGQLPHQFESKDQYERSLRMPKGPEWTTKKTYQDGTKPRIMVKQGIILPPERPMA